MIDQKMAGEVSPSGKVLIPGQAAAYKIGEKKIHELRKKFEAKDGREYNLVGCKTLQI